MGILDDRDDKTEPATGKRKADARQKGQVGKSKELSMAGLIIAAIILLEYTGSWIIDALKEIMRTGFKVKMHEEVGIAWATQHFHNLALTILPAMLPFFIGMVFMALAINYLQVGWKITWAPLKPNLDRLNPMKGLKKLFSLSSFMPFFLAILKFTVLISTLYYNVKGDIPILLQLQGLPVEVAVPIVAKLAFKILWWIAIPLLLIGLIDFIYQKWKHAKDIRMSKQDIKDEHKNQEGDPEIKARIKRAQRQMAMNRMMSDVPKADVVITNPTHYALALRYDRVSMAAPKVVAKGTDEVASKIRELAKEHSVPIMEDPPLARSLYRACKVGDEIPHSFYQAVATVLSHVLKMKQKVG